MANSNEEINEIFREIVQKTLPEKLVVNFVVVAEIADETGSQLSLFVSDSMSPWLAHGMLEYAIDMVDSGNIKDDDES
jgi:2-succinyl-5-enolpyruvyl-6-hydroxy-3-cyclohexene-1-carboxylate synthase